MALIRAGIAAYSVASNVLSGVAVASVRGIVSGGADCPFISSGNSPSCCSCDQRSCSRGGRARGAQHRGLHQHRNCSVLHRCQDDVRSGLGQRGRCSCGQPGGHSAVTGSHWTLPVKQVHPGLCWGCSRVLSAGLAIAPCPSPPEKRTAEGPAHPAWPSEGLLCCPLPIPSDNVKMLYPTLPSKIRNKGNCWTPPWALPSCTGLGPAQQGGLWEALI